MVLAAVGSPAWLSGAGSRPEPPVALWSGSDLWMPENLEVGTPRHSQSVDF
jgi:hypothetical protein